jgi:predicted 2-oxoglutarate/Fe(II)-dependent dioxygenase YbiX
MRSHYDHIHSIFDGDRKGIPVLSILGVLNDDYKGGNFLFNDEHEVKLRQGDILIFPSIFLYPHKVKEVTEGTRYSFITWAF